MVGAGGGSGSKRRIGSGERSGLGMAGSRNVRRADKGLVFVGDFVRRDGDTHLGGSEKRLSIATKGSCTLSRSSWPTPLLTSSSYTDAYSESWSSASDI